jgi:hypothetical protein
MTGKSPLRYVPDSLTHLLDEIETDRDANEAKATVTVQLDEDTRVVLGAPKSFWDLACERSNVPKSELLGWNATVHGLGEGKIVASWEARRDVEPWEEAPVVTFLLMVNFEDKTKILERADVTVFKKCGPHLGAS